MQDEVQPLGAYGLRLRGIEAADLLVEADTAWPEVELSATVGTSAVTTEHLSDDRAVLRLRNGGHITLARRTGRAEYVVPHALNPEELVHPYLAPVAAVMAHWLGRQGFHAGGVAIGGRVWGVIGERFAGKSTMLAQLALTGHDVVADDLLVLDGSSDDVFAGPRSVDLRADAAERLGTGGGIGVAGARERWRLRLPPVPTALTMSGWIFLAWGEDIEVRSTRGPARLTRLAEQRAVRLSPGDPARLLELAALPSFELRRPQEWGTVEPAAEILLETITG